MCGPGPSTGLGCCCNPPFRPAGLGYPGLQDVWGPIFAQKYKNTLECTILKRKIQKFSPKRSPAEMLGSFTRMFPLVPLWLLAGLV